MATVNTVQCVTGAQNTNMGNCFFDPKNFVGAFLCPPNYVIPASALATLQTQLTTDSTVDNKASRIYPVPNFFDFKDASEKPVEEKFGYGQVNTVRDGVYDWQFRYRLGGLNLSNALRSFNGASYSFLYVDSKGQLVGTSTFDNTGAATIGGIPPVEFYQDPFMPNDGKKTSEYWAKFRFLPKYINEQVAYITDAGFDILTVIKGLISVKLTGAIQSVALTYNVTPTTVPAGTNLAALYPTALAAGAVWTATNHATGAAVVINTVTLNANGTSFDILLTTGANYPAIGGKMDFNLVGPTELATALVPGYESLGPVTITRAV